MKNMNKKGGEIEEAKKGELLGPAPRDYTVNFEFPDPEPLSIPVIQVVDAAFGYDPNRLLFQGVQSN
jgi:ATPase subunit of ABC transporter with duplicated ATPase domains